MTDTDIAFRTVLTGKFQIPAQAITPGATLEELDLDSLALAELALTLHEELGIRVEEHEARRDTTVAELAATLLAKRNAAGAP